MSVSLPLSTRCSLPRCRLSRYADPLASPRLYSFLIRCISIIYTTFDPPCSVVEVDAIRSSCFVVAESRPASYRLLKRSCTSVSRTVRIKCPP